MVAEGFGSAGAVLGEVGRYISDLTAAMDSASAGGGCVEVCAEAGGCLDCIVSVRAVVVEDDLGNSDVAAEVGSGSTEDAGDSEEDLVVACWLESLSCEVTELEVRDLSFSEMHCAARSTSFSLSISDSKMSKVISKARRFEASDGSSIGIEG